MDGLKRREERRQYWLGWVEKWQAKGGTKKAFCAEHELPLYSFYDWSRRLVSVADESGGFARMSCRGSSGVRLHLGPGVVAELEPDFDTVTLRRLLAVVGSPC